MSLGSTRLGRAVRTAVPHIILIAFSASILPRTLRSITPASQISGRRVFFGRMLSGNHRDAEVIGVSSTVLLTPGMEPVKRWKPRSRACGVASFAEARSTRTPLHEP